MIPVAMAGRAMLRRAIVASVFGIALAGAAAAQSGTGLPGGQQRLDVLLDNISTVPHRNWPKAAEAFIQAASEAEMADVVAVAIPALGDPREEQRYYALVGLGAAAMASVENGEALAAEAVALVDSLSDDDPWVREAAVAALAAIQPGPPEWTVGDIAALVDDPVRRVAVAAMRTLERVAVGDNDAAGIHAMLDAGDGAERSRAIKVLSRHYRAQGNYREAEWTMIDGLDDPDRGVRWQAATALGDLDDANWSFALWRLDAVRRNPKEDPAVRRAASTAMNNILDRRPARSALAGPASVRTKAGPSLVRLRSRSGPVRIRD